MLSVLLIPFPFPGDVTLLITLFHSKYLFCQSAPRPRPMPSTVCSFCTVSRLKSCRASRRSGEQGASLIGGAIALISACRFVRNGHCQQIVGQQRLEYLVPKLGAVGAICDGHQIGNLRIYQAFAQDFNLVPT